MTITHPPICQVRFTLPQHHREQDSTKWRKHPHKRTPLAPKDNTENPPQARLTEQYVKQGVLEGSIPSEAWDTACTSYEDMLGDPFIQTEQSSNNIFALSYGHPIPATNKGKLEHRVCELTSTVNMVTSLANQSLLSGGKFAEAGYVSVCDGDEVKIYNGRTTKITVSEDMVLKGWRSSHTKLWRIPLQAQVST